MFRENPSESKEYKPLALFEPIGEDYLDFLLGLRIDMAEHGFPDSFFEVTGASQAFETGKEQSFLVLLSPQNPHQRQCVFHGTLRCEKSENLVISLSGLRRIIRVHHTDAQSVFRYYIDHFQEEDAAVPNYIVIQSQNTYTDIILPHARI